MKYKHLTIEEREKEESGRAPGAANEYLSQKRLLLSKDRILWKKDEESATGNRTVLNQEKTNRESILWSKDKPEWSLSPN